MFNNLLFLDKALQRQLTQKELFKIQLKIAGESNDSLAVQASRNESDHLLTRQQLLEVCQNISILIVMLVFLYKIDDKLFL